MHIITDISEHDNKRNKVILDEGELTFLLYKGELRQAGIRKNDEISDDKYEELMSLLLLRAKKRSLYYLKDEDKTEYKIKEKLKQGLYPDEIIEKTLKYLREHSFSDDARYAETFVEEQRGKRGRREIEAKLYQRGVNQSVIKEALSILTEEDELLAAEASLRKCTSKDPYAYLLRKGFSGHIAERIVGQLGESS